MTTPGEVRIVVRNVWQGLLEWWNPPGAGSAGAPGPPAVRGSANAPGGVEIDRHGDSQASEPTPLPATATRESETPKRARLVDVSRRATDEIDSTDEELMEFLAADHEPVAADPEFKRKLRDQLWTLVQGNELTRQ
jgi:hypothetical protein